MSLADVRLLTGTDDATCTQANGGYTDSGSFLAFTSNASTSTATAIGMRYLIPTGINASDITAAYLMIAGNNSLSATSCQILVEQTVAAGWANDATNRPMARWTTATGPSTPVTWNIPASRSSETIASPDISADLKVAMAAGVAGSDYVGVLVKMSNGTGGGQVQARDGGGVTSAKPTLRIVHSGTQSATITDIYYGNGYGDGAYRVFDINYPTGSPPAGGWKPFFWLHGGFWISGTTKAVLPSEIVTRMNARGYAVIGLEYDLCTANAVTQIGNSFPQNVNGVRNALDYCTRWSTALGLNMAKVVLSGHSSGGHVALFSALTLADTSNYTGYQNVNTNRKAQTPNTRPTFDFDCDITAQTFTIKGAFIWTAPIDIYQVTQVGGVVDSTQAAISTASRATLMGEKTAVTPSSAQREADINGYIDNTTNATYGTTTHEPTIPIGYVEATGDTIIDPSAGVTALYNALGTSGFTYARPATNTTTATGLSRYQISGTHGGAMNASAGLDYLEAWDDAVNPSAAGGAGGPGLPSLPSMPSIG